MSNHNIYFKTDLGVLYLGDCREILKTFPSNSIDLVITDPPYQKKRKLSFMDDSYGSLDIIFEIEDELWRVLKKDAWFILYWGVKNLPEAFRFKKFEYVWQIVSIFPSSFSKCVLGDRKYFIILVFKKGNPKVVFRRTDIVYNEELPFIQEKIAKPDFKSTGVNARLIQMFMKKTDVVLDPFAGWGSLLKVCELFKRRWIGIEINEERVKFAKEFISS